MYVHACLQIAIVPPFAVFGGSHLGNPGSMLNKIVSVVTILEAAAVVFGVIFAYDRYLSDDAIRRIQQADREQNQNRQQLQTTFDLLRQGASKEISESRQFLISFPDTLRAVGQTEKDEIIKNEEIKIIP